MSSFRFEASDSAGRIEKGLVEADSPAAARSALRARGLIPLAVDDVKPTKQASARRIRRRFGDGELVLVTRQLAGFLAPGLRGARGLSGRGHRGAWTRQPGTFPPPALPVAQALGATIDQADEPAVRDVFA